MVTLSILDWPNAYCIIFGKRTPYCSFCGNKTYVCFFHVLVFFSAAMSSSWNYQKNATIGEFSASSKWRKTSATTEKVASGLHFSAQCWRRMTPKSVTNGKNLLRCVNNFKTISCGKYTKFVVVFLLSASSFVVVLDSIYFQTKLLLRGDGGS